MNAVILNGSGNSDTALEKVQQAIIDELTDKNWEIKPLILHNMDIRPCAGCFGCWKICTPDIPPLENETEGKKRI